MSLSAGGLLGVLRHNLWPVTSQHSLAGLDIVEDVRVSLGVAAVAVDLHEAVLVLDVLSVRGHADLSLRSLRLLQVVLHRLAELDRFALHHLLPLRLHQAHLFVGHHLNCRERRLVGPQVHDWRVWILPGREAGVGLTLALPAFGRVLPRDAQNFLGCPTLLDQLSGTAAVLRLLAEPDRAFRRLNSVVWDLQRLDCYRLTLDWLLQLLAGD